MGVELESVEVDVKIHWDFRGTMGVDHDVPVGATGVDLRSWVKTDSTWNSGGPGSSNRGLPPDISYGLMFWLT